MKIYRDSRQFWRHLPTPTNVIYGPPALCTPAHTHTSTACGNCRCRGISSPSRCPSWIRLAPRISHHLAPKMLISARFQLPLLVWQRCSSCPMPQAHTPSPQQSDVSHCPQHKIYSRVCRKNLTLSHSKFTLPYTVFSIQFGMPFS